LSARLVVADAGDIQSARLRSFSREDGLERRLETKV